MNYELALKLKEAGFPNILAPNPANNNGNSFRTNISLSELIEACPKNQKLHDMVFDFTLMYIGTQWFAGYWAYDYSEGAEGRAATPEGAVAKLWLALNPPSLPKA